MTTATAAELEAAWAERVRANRDQVDRVREVPDRDFYAPVSSLFVADPRRTGEEALDALLTLAEPDDRWLDIGAGAGRYALPLAAQVAEVIAVEPSASMRNALRTGKEEHGLDNVRVVAGAWPEALGSLGEPPVADVSFIAHVGYDIEEIGPFIDGMERAASRLCVAMLTDQSPASVADPFWPVVHGMERVPLPALPELVELLRARGRGTEIRRVERARGRSTRSGAWLRSSPSAVDRRRRGEGGAVREALVGMARERDDDGWTLASPPVGSIGILLGRDLTWSPPG